MNEPNRTPIEATKPPRTPVEKAVVWGGIAVLGGVMLFEARASFGYSNSLKTLSKKLGDDGNDVEFKVSQVRSMLSGQPSEIVVPRETRFHRFVELKWASLFKDYRVLLQVDKSGDDPIVLGFQTPDSEEPQVTVDPSPSAGGGTPAAQSMARESAPAANQPSGATAPAVTAPAAAGGASGAGGGRARGLGGLAQREDVAAELKLSEEQLTKLKSAGDAARSGFMNLQNVPEAERPAAMRKARADAEKAVQEVLDEAQFQRLQQLFRRETGLAALDRDEVSALVGLTDEQKETLKGVMADRQKAMQGLRDASPEEAAKVRAEWDEKLRVLLTPEQLQKWEASLGEPLPTPSKSEPAATPTATDEKKS
jgi:hypothetical protein